MSPQIGLTGDVMLGRRVNERQQHRAPKAVWGSMYEALRACEGLLINLECCLSPRGETWARTRRVFHFRANPEWAIPALRTVGVDCCALANNHILDYEVEALRDTLDELDEAGIARSGAGQSRDEALEPAIVDVDGVRLAVISMTDNTPEYAAGDETPGTAYIEIDIDHEETRERVEEAMTRAVQNNPDLIVASLHWGPNMRERPPDRFQTFAHWLIDREVDIVHGHSAHVFQGIEIHEGHPILYDTGDFVDDYAIDERLRNDRSFLFRLDVTEEGAISELRLTPTEIDEYAVHRASPAVAQWSRKRMRSLSEPFGTTFNRDGEELVVTLD